MNYLKTISVALAIIAVVLVALPPCAAKQRKKARKSSSSENCDVTASLQEMRAEIKALASEVKQIKHQISETCGADAHDGPQLDKPDSVQPDNDTSSACGAHQYECKDGSCMDISVRCNFIINCPDGEDEEFCYEISPTTSGDMDHGDMDHGDMDHGDMDHGGMDYPVDISPEDFFSTTESPTTTPIPTTTTTSTTTTTQSTTTTTTLPPPEGPPPEVPNCVAPYLQVGHSCFYSFTYFEDWRSWGEANAKCQTIGGMLASPWNFVDLQQFLVQRYTTTFWVGIHFRIKDKTWMWLSGKKMAKEFWKPGQPSRGAKRCAYLDFNANFKAVSHYCGEKYPFICEMKPKA